MNAPCVADSTLGLRLIFRIRTRFNGSSSDLLARFAGEGAIQVSAVALFSSEDPV
jgi:hypothetical protein